MYRIATRIKEEKVFERNKAEEERYMKETVEEYRKRMIKARLEMRNDPVLAQYYREEAVNTLDPNFHRLADRLEANPLHFPD